MRWTVWLACLAGCASSMDEEQAPSAPGGSSPTEAPAPELIEKLRNASVTEARPEVGRINGCTATLVAAEVAITAAHCVDHGTRSGPGRYNTLRLTRGGETRSFVVSRYRSFSRRSPGENDIALLGLSEPVPADFATPAPLGAELPPAGASLTVYGYGCMRIGGSGDGRKRRATYAQGDRAQHLCPGDSGGPVFHDELGAIVRINSGIIHDAGYTDIYGMVPPMHAQLVEQVRAWSDGPIPELGAPTPPDPEVRICGRGLDVFDTWTCTGPRAHRYRCPRGGTPAWEECLQACESRPGADVCAGPPATPQDMVFPAVRVVTPGTGHAVAPGDSVQVEALVHDDGVLASVHLVWSYNNQSYACPSRSRSVDCEVDGATYRWTVRVDRAGLRAFHVRAEDAGANVHTSKPRTIHVVDPPVVEPDPEEEEEDEEDEEPEAAPPPDDPPDAPPPEPEDEPELGRPPPPKAPGAPETPDAPQLEIDNGVPTLEVVEPSDGSLYLTDSEVEVVARIEDAEGVAGASLFWGYNQRRYACPSQGERVSCVTDGDVYRWTVQVGEAGARPFQVSARNSRGRTTTAPERAVQVRPSLDETAPRITIVAPTPDTEWRANSTVEVEALVRDDGEVASAVLVWDFNGNDYACPRSGQTVSCTVSGDRYTWRLRVSTGDRPFQIRARDDQGNEALSPRRSLRLQE